MVGNIFLQVNAIKKLSRRSNLFKKKHKIKPIFIVFLILFSACCPSLLFNAFQTYTRMENNYSGMPQEFLDDILKTSGLKSWTYLDEIELNEPDYIKSVSAYIVEDVDGDGDYEIMVAGGCWKNYGTTQAFDILNYKNGVLTREGHLTFSDTTWNIETADIDFDGKIEILIGNRNKNWYIYEWDGSSFTLQQSKTCDGETHLYCGNIDDDDDLELINFEGWTDYDVNFLEYNNSTGNFEVDQVIDTLPDAVGPIGIMDVDGDGLNEIMAVCQSNFITIGYNTSTGTYQQEDLINNVQPAFAYDFDFDGQGEFISEDAVEGLEFWDRVGGTWQRLAVWNGFTGMDGVLWRNLDGDDNIEFMISPFDNDTMWVYEYDYKSKTFRADFSLPLNPASKIIQIPAGRVSNSQAFADDDNDGYLEIVFSGNDGTADEDPQISVYELDYHVGSSPSVPVLEPISPSTSHTGDIFLDWSDVPDADYYLVYKCNSETFDAGQSTIVKVYGTQYFFINLEHGDCSFAVTAVKNSIESDFSNVETVTISNLDFISSLTTLIAPVNPILSNLIMNVIEAQENWENILSNAKATGKWDVELEFQEKKPLFGMLGIKFPLVIKLSIRWNDAENKFYFDFEPKFESEINLDVKGKLGVFSGLIQAISKIGFKFELETSRKVTLFSYSETENKCEFSPAFELTINPKIVKTIPYIEGLLMVADPSQVSAITFSTLNKFLYETLDIDLNEMLCGKLKLEFPLTISLYRGGIQISFSPRLTVAAISMNINAGLGDPEFETGVFGEVTGTITRTPEFSLSYGGGIYFYLNIDLDEFITYPIIGHAINDLVLNLANHGIKQHNQWKIFPQGGDSYHGTSMTGLSIKGVQNDTDGDCLTDEEEVIYGTNSSLVDTDADGLWDYTEVKVAGSNPLVPDTDGDGIMDFDEYNVYCTNPNSTDSDNDNMTDYDEIFLNGTNPTKTDTDWDGLTDWEEPFKYFTNSSDEDTDDDGFSDGDEIFLYETDPTDNDSYPVDTDGDGVYDVIEINVLGTDPNSDDSIDVDHDGLSYIQEVFLYRTDPTRADTDFDGLLDGMEVFVFGTCPAMIDTDRDGFIDSIEIFWGSNPTTASSIPLNLIYLVGGIILTGMVALAIKVYIHRKRKKMH